MKLNAFQFHRFWLIRAGLVLLITVLADGKSHRLSRSQFHG
jgi:hypothetical protein